MKKRIPLSIFSLAAAFIFSTSLFAQEKTEITIQVKKDGKVVKDTTYQFDDAAEAKHAVKMLEIISGDEEHMMHFDHSKASDSDSHSKTMVFISEDGKKTEIKEFHGDSLVWISEEEIDGDHVKVIKKKMVTGDHPHGEGGDHPHGEHVMIIKSEGGETIDVIVSEDIEMEKGKTKQVKVIVSGDEDGTWHVDHKELKEVDEEVYVISGDDAEEELKEILKDHDGENVKVIVVKKKSKEQ